MTLPSPRWLCLIGASLSLLAILCVGSNYADWKTARLRKSAERAIEANRPVEAALDAAAGLQIRPGDPTLTSLLGDAYDATNDERLLDVLAQQTEENPRALDPRFRLARAALRFGRLDISAEAVAEMPPHASATTDFHEISAALATVAKRGDRLLDHARQLHQLEPENDEHLLKLAGLAVLASSNLLGPDEFAKLRALSQQPEKVTEAVQASILLWAISRLDDYPGTDRLPVQQGLLPTLARPGVSFDTRMQALDLASAIGESPTANQILDLLKSGATSSRDQDEIGVLLAWLNRKGEPTVAMDWARQLGLFSGEKPSPTLGVVLAESCARGAAWRELGWLVTGTDWGRGDFIRHFYAAKCAAERPSITSELERESFLRLALGDSDTNPAHLHLLWQTARKYGWRDLAKPLSWTLVDRTHTVPEIRSLLQAISADALAVGDLDEFRRATTAQLKLSPGQWELRNNDYYTALLRDGCSESMLEEITAFHAEFHTHPDVSATYAFALHLSGDSATAAEMLMALDEEARRSPAIAPFCALVFAANGDAAKSAHYRKLPHQLYFAEERALFAASG